MTDKQLTEVTSKEIDKAIKSVANAVFYHYMDESDNVKLQSALKELVTAIINQNKQS